MLFSPYRAEKPYSFGVSSQYQSDSVSKVAGANDVHQTSILESVSLRPSEPFLRLLSLSSLHEVANLIDNGVEVLSFVGFTISCVDSLYALCNRVKKRVCERAYTTS